MFWFLDHLTGPFLGLFYGTAQGLRLFLFDGILNALGSIALFFFNLTTQGINSVWVMVRDFVKYNAIFHGLLLYGLYAAIALENPLAFIVLVAAGLVVLSVVYVVANAFTLASESFNFLAAIGRLGFDLFKSLVLTALAASVMPLVGMKDGLMLGSYALVYQIAGWQLAPRAPDLEAQGGLNQPQANQERRLSFDLNSAIAEIEAVHAAQEALDMHNRVQQLPQPSAPLPPLPLPSAPPEEKVLSVNALMHRVMAVLPWNMAMAAEPSNKHLKTLIKDLQDASVESRTAILQELQQLPPHHPLHAEVKRLNEEYICPLSNGGLFELANPVCLKVQGEDEGQWHTRAYEALDFDWMLRSKINDYCGDPISQKPITGAYRTWGNSSDETTKRPELISVDRVVKDGRLEVLPKTVMVIYRGWPSEVEEFLNKGLNNGKGQEAPSQKHSSANMHL